MIDSKYTSSIVGFMLPPDFDASTYDAVFECIKVGGIQHPLRREFLAAWKTIAHRFRTAAECDEEFTASITISNSPPANERYLQERALFAFFTSGISAVECWFYAMNCLGAIVRPESFPASESGHLNVTPATIGKRFEAAFPQDGITKIMGRCLDSTDFKHFNDWRNVLSHRGIPPREFYVGGHQDGQARTPANPKVLSAEWQFSLQLDTQTTAVRRRWLSGILADLLLGAEQFCLKRL